jgi:hypothetical protein
MKRPVIRSKKSRARRNRAFLEAIFARYEAKKSQDGAQGLLEELGGPSGSEARGTDSALTEAPAQDNKAIDPSDSSARNILGTPPEIDESHHHKQFDHEVGQAGLLAREIVKIEDEIGDKTEDAARRLAPLQTALVLSGLRAARLVDDGKVSNAVVEKFAEDAGIKPHGNAAVPYSRLIRAIFARETKKGTKMHKRMQQRATTFAGAIAYALKSKMRDDEFSAELDAPRKRGQYHGIEELAGKERELRSSKGRTQAQPVPPPMPYRVAGDFADVEPGMHLMLVDVVKGANDMAGMLLEVTDALLRRAITADEKARLKAA